MLYPPCQILSEQHIITQEVRTMETHFVVMSETYAEKARQLRERYRYRFRMQRITASSGCAYHFRVSAEAGSILPLLSSAGIPYQSS